MIEYLSNEELLERYQNGSFDAFDQFFQNTSGLIFNYLIFRLRTREDAEEVLQEVYIRIHNNILRYDSSKPALSWVFTIAKNLMIDKIRSRRSSNVELQELPSDEVGAVSKIIDKEQLELLLAKCTEEERALLREKFVEGYSYEELAENRSSNVLSLRQKVSRILKKIRT